LKYCAIALICILSLGGLLSCGLEEYYYIDYIPRRDYESTRAILDLPSSSTEGYNYFDNFIIFYRIYISESNASPGRPLESDSGLRSAISSAFNSDYNGLYSLTDITSTSVNTSNLENTFSNRNYFLLSLEGAAINNVLGSGSLGRRLYIAFPPNPGDQPTLTVYNPLTDGDPTDSAYTQPRYALQRAVANQISGISFEALPDRRFLNHPDLYNTANITSGRNADVAANSAANLLYTYVSMYIAAKGRSTEMPPRIIYSQPTFIGIFLLAPSGN